MFTVPQFAQFFCAIARYGVLHAEDVLRLEVFVDFWLRSTAKFEWSYRVSYVQVTYQVLDTVPGSSLSQQI